MVSVVFPPEIALSNEGLVALCAANKGMRIERRINGQLQIMPPTGGETGYRNSRLNFHFNLWGMNHPEGLFFDSSTGFFLPDGSMRSADLAWILRSRWEELTSPEREGFPPLCPDFVLELRSASDRLTDLQEKMEEWMHNGCRLAWLVDPVGKKTLVFQGSEAPFAVPFPQALSGGEVLSGLELIMDTIIG